MNGRLGVGLLVLLPLGCTVTAVSPQSDARPNNSCTSNSDCSGQTHCSDGLCVALNGKLETLLVTVTPPSDSSVPHLTFVTNVEEVPTSGGSKTLSLAGPSRVTGSLQRVSADDCYPTFVDQDPDHPLFKAPDGVSLPAEVTFSLEQRVLGLPQQVYFASTGDELTKGGYHFDVQVPAGDYDVYLVPPANQASDCAIPPQLVRGKAVKEGLVEIPFLVAPISKLALNLHWPKSSTSLDGWTADIIEPLGGRPISTEVVLRDSPSGADAGSSIEYAVSLSYSPVVEAQGAGSATSPASASDLFRLRPPSGVVAPTIFLDRSALGLFPGKSVDLSAFTHYPTAVRVEGQLVSRDSGKGVAGQVTFVSTAISGVDPGIFASFQTSLDVDEQGVFDVDLPPGEYRVQAVPQMAAGTPPAAGALSALEVAWKVPGDVAFQAGKLIELPPFSELSGQVRLPGAQVQALPSPQTVLPFEQAFGAGPFSPRAAAAVVDDSGRFELQADPGKFDFSVRPPEELGFAWFVRPGLEVADSDQDLGRISLPSPAVMSGTALVGEVPLSSAAVRAYVYLDKDLAYTRDPKQAVSVAQVAETRADADGVFRLLLPEQIAASK